MLWLRIAEQLCSAFRHSSERETDRAHQSRRTGAPASVVGRSLPIRSHASRNRTAKLEVDRDGRGDRRTRVVVDSLSETARSSDTPRGNRSESRPFVGGILRLHWIDCRLVLSCCSPQQGPRAHARNHVRTLRHDHVPLKAGSIGDSGPIPDHWRSNLAAIMLYVDRVCIAEIVKLKDFLGD